MTLARQYKGYAFNNTIFRCGVGVHKGMTRHNRCFYLRNLMLDIGSRFIQQEPRDDAIEYDSFAYARNFTIVVLEDWVPGS